MALLNKTNTEKRRLPAKVGPGACWEKGRPHLSPPFTYLESVDGTSETRVDAAELLMLTLTRCLFSTSLLHSQQQPELKVPV